MAFEDPLRALEQERRILGPFGAPTVRREYPNSLPLLLDDPAALDDVAPCQDDRLVFQGRDPQGRPWPPETPIRYSNERREIRVAEHQRGSAGHSPTAGLRRSKPAILAI